MTEIEATSDSVTTTEELTATITTTTTSEFILTSESTLSEIATETFTETTMETLTPSFTPTLTFSSCNTILQPTTISLRPITLVQFYTSCTASATPLNLASLPSCSECFRILSNPDALGWTYGFENGLPCVCKSAGLLRKRELLGWYDSPV